MAIVKRLEKGTALTYAEMDNNFTELESLSSSSVSTPTTILGIEPQYIRTVKNLFADYCVVSQSRIYVDFKIKDGVDLSDVGTATPLLMINGTMNVHTSKFDSKNNQMSKHTFTEIKVSFIVNVVDDGYGNYSYQAQSFTGEQYFEGTVDSSVLRLVLGVGYYQDTQVVISTEFTIANVFEYFINAEDVTVSIVAEEVTYSEM